MRSLPQLQHAISLAHNFWSKLLQPGDSVVDATCGNGHDSLFLANLILRPGQGNLHVIDIQEDAILSTQTHLHKHLPLEVRSQIQWHCTCHSMLSQLINSPVKLVVYNLGYLPGGNKKQTTLEETTMSSVNQALTLIQPTGALSITCYPGHEAGAIEEQALLNWAHQLDKKRYCVTHHKWVNRMLAPSLLFIEKMMPAQAASKNLNNNNPKLKNHKFSVDCALDLSDHFEANILNISEKRSGKGEVEDALNL